MTGADKLYQALEWAALILASLFILSFVYVAFLSMGYPFHIEWMEGHMLDAVQRVRDGKGIYVEPSLEFIPYLYTPYYYYAVAFVSLFTGVDFFAARLLSTLSALGVGGILYFWVKREGGSWLHGIIAAGLFFATYKLSGRWLDLSRIDSLFLLLTLGGLYAFFHWQGRRGELAAAGLLAAAFFTKQSALIAVAPVMAVFLFLEPRRTLFTGSVMAALIVAGVALLHFNSNGWSSFYMFELPSYHRFDGRYIYSFWTKGLPRPQVVVILLSLLALLYMWSRDRRKALRYAGLLTGLILCSYIMRINSWSYINVYIPAHAVLALFTGLSLPFLAQSKQKILQLCWPLLISAHFLSLTYNPNQLIPSDEARAEGEKFLKDLAQVQGDVFIPDLQFVQTRIGKKSYAFGMAAFDIFNTDLGDKNYLRGQLRGELSSAIRDGKFDAIMPGKVTRLPERKRQYIYKETLQYPTEYLTGIVRSVPMEIYVRRTPQ